MIITNEEYQRYQKLEQENKDLLKELDSVKDILSSTEKICDDLERKCGSVIDISVVNHTEHISQYGDEILHT